MLLEYTNEEQQELKKIDLYYAKKLDKLDEILATAEPGSKAYNEAAEEHTYLNIERMGDFSAFYRDCELKRFEIIREDVKEIIADAKRQVLLIIKNYYEELNDNYDKGLQQGTETAMAVFTDDGILLNANVIAATIKRNLDLHYDALAELPDKVKELNDYIAKAVTESPYTIIDTNTDQLTTLLNKKYFPVYHGAATDKLALVTSKGAAADIMGDATLAGPDELKVISKNFKQITANLNVNTHKLLSTGITFFADTNAYYKGKKRRKASNYRVSFPLEWYAMACGKDIEIRPTDTPEAAEKEAKRVAELKKKFKREIKKQGELLRSLNLSWNENVRGKENFFETDILSAFGVIDNQICMTFAPDWADYLIRLPLTQYDKALLSIDPRQDNAYRVGLKLTEHYNMDNNQIRGSANTLKVKTLLQVTSLPDKEKLEASKETRKWKQRIKKPLEDALNVLKENLLKEWHYVDSTNKKMSLESSNKLKTLEEFTELKVKFTLKNPPDHTDRLERRAAEKAEKAKELEEKKEAQEAKKNSKK